MTANRFLLLFIGSLLTAAVSCGPSGNPGPAMVSAHSGPKNISKARPGVLRVVLGGNYPPFHWTTADNRHRGILVEMLRVCAARAGVRLEFRFLDSWKRALEMVYAGESDMIIPLYKTGERMRKMRFFERGRLAPESNVLAVRSGSSLVYSGNLRVLSNRLVGAIRGYSYGSGFDLSSNISKAYAADEVALLKQLMQPERLDIIIGSLPVLRFQIRRLQLQQKVRLLFPPVSREWLYAGFSRMLYESGVIRDAVDRLLYQMELYRNSAQWKDTVGKYVE